jgi:HlyD family secretion protein
MEPQASTSPERSALDEFLGRQPASERVQQLRKAAPVLGLLLLAGLAALYFTGRRSDQPSYATTPVQRGDLRVTVSATGNLQPTNEVEVGSELSGLVTEVNVDNNDRVTKGQVLARIDTARLQDAIAQSRASLQSAVANVAQAEATVQQTKASLARFEEVHARSGGKVPSAGVRTAAAGVALARAQLSSDQTQFSKALILSPVTGVVLSRQIDPGQTVAASFNAPVLFLIAEDLSAMRLEVKVDEADVGQVTAGQTATFQVDAFPGRTFPARVERVDVGANASTGSAASSSSSSTVVAYTAVLTVDNKDATLRPGMTATAEIVTSEKRDVLLVPNAALRFSPDAGTASGERSGVTKVLLPGPPRGTASKKAREVQIGRGSAQTVYILDAEGEPESVAVTTGDTNGTLTEVTGDSLREGAAVITGKLATEDAGG